MRIATKYLVQNFTVNDKITSWQVMHLHGDVAGLGGGALQLPQAVQSKG